jgi:ABC-type nickel/cobalt efflux system permease component RcnA
MNGIEAELLRIFDSAVAAPVALVLSALVGAGHGLAPGHGKSIAAGYLVSEEARYGRAVALALIVAVMHTASVVVLGVLWWLTVDVASVRLEAVTRWIQAAMALCVVVLGTILLRRRWRESGSGHAHRHVTGRSWLEVCAAAAAGGLLPSPSAFLVLVSGLLSGRAGLALAMVAMFGLGLAAVVLVVGSLTIAGRTRFAHSSRPSWRKVHQLAPLLGAAAVVVGGCVLLWSAVSGLVALT